MKTQFKSSSKKTGGDIASINLMRGIASLMVCYFHLSWGNERFLPGENLIKVIGKWGWAGVEIFFIISGFVIPYSMFIKNYSFRNIGLFLKKRIIRIEPSYLISIILVLILSFISTLMPSYRGMPFTINWVNIFSHIAYLNIFTGQKWLQDVYWTLAIEFQYYLLISLVFGLIISKNNYYRLIFYIFFLLAHAFKFYNTSFILGYTGYFMLGILLFQYYSSIIEAKEFWLLVFINFCVLYYFEGIVLTSLSGLTLFIIAFVKKVPAFFQFLGVISYSLYLIHIPVGGRIINLTENFTKNIYLKEGMFFFAFSFCILASYFFYTMVEKRFKNLAASIKYKNH